MPRFAANLTVLFTELPFEERFDAAARVGFRAVECLFPYDWPAAALAGRLRDAGLELVLFNAPPGDWEAGELGLAALPGRQQDFRDSLDLALDYAATLGAPQVHVMAGVPPADCDRSTALALYGENLAWAAKRAAGAGLRILIEPINDRDHPGYLLTTAAGCWRSGSRP